MSASYIGSKISLISKSEIRYEGILYTIDPKESTISLAKVRTFGTENRATIKPFPPKNEVYEYIIFRASDIKDLLVDDSGSPPPGLSDPAIIQAQSVGGPQNTSFSSGAGFGSVGGTRNDPAVTPPTVHQAASKPQTVARILQDGPSSGVIGGQRRGSRGASPTRKSPVPQEERKPRRAPSDNPQSQSQRRPQSQRQGVSGPNEKPSAWQVQGGGRQAGQRSFQNRNRQGSDWPSQRSNASDWPSRPSQGQGQRTPRQKPTMLDVRKLEEYDFEKANAQFVELTKEVEDLKIDGVKQEGDAQDTKTETIEIGYNKSKSFFDSISCEAVERAKGNTNRIDRHQERKQNQETFGVDSVYRTWNRRGRGGYFNRGYQNRNGEGQRRNFGHNRGSRNSQATAEARQ